MCAADRVEHQVYATARGDALEFGAQVLLRIVDQEIRPAAITFSPAAFAT